MSDEELTYIKQTIEEGGEDDLRVIQRAAFNLLQRYEQQERQIARYREALEKYADETSWGFCTSDSYQNLWLYRGDGYTRAKEALQK